MQDNKLPVLIQRLMKDRRMLAFAGVLAVLVIAATAFSRAAPAPIVVNERAPAQTEDEVAEEATTSPDSVLEDSSAAAGPAAGVAASELAFEPIADGVPRMRKPEVVRGLYLNAWAAGSERKLERLIDVANRTEINAFVIDVKEGGEVSYRSRVPLVSSIGAQREYIRDIRGVLRKLRANGIYPIARIVVFKDAKLAEARPGLAVQHVAGGEWKDRDGYRWVDSFNRQVWDYNIALAREALELGFAEVQWDYVRFPDVPPSLMRNALWPAQAGRTKADGIREFILYSREQLAQYEVPITADVFGLTTSVRNDLGIGQQWEKLSEAADVLLPMVYPSHYGAGSYGFAQPNANPYGIVKRALEYAVERNAKLEKPAVVRAWLQDFTLGAPAYGPAHVRAQIQAVYDAGLTEWVLWHPGSNYTVEALADANGVAPKFPLPGPDTMKQPDTVRAAPDTAGGVLGRPVKPDSIR